jgi:serine/threonine protein phosphatase 1
MGERLFAIGDIHGCLDSLVSLVEDRIKPEAGDRIVFLGDYIDRGPAIKETIDYILSLKEKELDITALMGNHELMMIQSADGERFESGWFMNGGFSTLKSFGIDSFRSLPGRYQKFFSDLPYYHRQDNFVFVHAGFNDGILDPFQDKVQMVWSRRESYSNPVFDGLTIVHGHTPVPLAMCRKIVESGDRVINLDTGCVYGSFGDYGHLTAIELKSRELFSV